MALGDWHRQAIIVALADTMDMTVKDVAAAIGLSRPATSHHLKALRDVGLLGERREGRRTYYYPTLRESFEELSALLDSVREHKIAQL